MTPALRLAVLPDLYAVCRLDASAAVPDWTQVGAFTSVTRTPQELSIVCQSASVPTEVTALRDWRCLRVEGPLDFALTGVMAALASPLAEAGVSIFTLATYDTDYLLVRAAQLAQAIAALVAAGHTVTEASASGESQPFVG
ncbi:MAG TPA: ACT domain-containing protein [Ktedonobacterales bacterium]